MLTDQQYIQFKAFARQDGAIMGVLWLFSFACFVMSPSMPLLSFAFDLSLLSIPFLASSQVKRYRDRIIDGTISFRRSYAYVLLVFLYATLIFALGQYVYFQYIDQGRLVGGMVKMINSEEFKPVIEAYHLSKSDIDTQLQLLSESRPIDFALTFIWFNVLAGTIIAWVTALFTKRTKRTER